MDAMQGAHGTGQEGRPLLGSPVSLTALRRVEGVVEVAPDGQLEGWAWLPGDPEAFPELRVFRKSRPDAVDALIASDESVAVPAGSGAIRPRGFRLDPHGLRGNGALHVIGSDDRPLIGSPCYPADEWRSAVANAASTKRLFHGRSRRGSIAAVRPGHWQPVPVSSEQILVARERLRNRKAVPARAPVDVIVPVYKGAGEFRNCLRSLERSLPSWARIVVVDDAAPDPVLRSAIEGAAADCRVVLLRHENNRGFPAAVNTGMRYALAGKSTGRDVVVLNSDTVVPNDWLEALVEVAYSAPDIGSCTPFSNDASVLSYPRLDAVNPALNGAETERLNSLFQRANGEASLELPTAVGFCMFIRRDCLADVGLFRDDLFAQGYGEENDWRPAARPVLDVAVDYDRTKLSTADLLRAKATLKYNGKVPTYMVIVDLGIPPGFTVDAGEFAEMVAAKKVQKFSVTARQVILVPGRREAGRRS